MDFIALIGKNTLYIFAWHNTIVRPIVNIIIAKFISNTDGWIYKSMVTIFVLIISLLISLFINIIKRRNYNIRVGGNNT